jgi:NAD(P)-dependent dehydrogenase (short-subunit alcohol dehydrogenase family)
MFQKIAIIGSNGAIGYAFKKHLSGIFPNASIFSFSSKADRDDPHNPKHYKIDYNDEVSIEAAVSAAYQNDPFDLVIVATGILHDNENLQPEKSLRDLSADKFLRLYNANTVFPAIVAKHIIPKLNRNGRSVFAALSARVGSISDNSLGGWYSYRASKTALNMIIKNLAIETARQNKEAVIVSLHPGTVDSGLSKPFQGQVKTGQLFTADIAAEKLTLVLNSLTPNESGRCFAWDGEEILP